MAELWSFAAPHAMLIAGLPGGTCPRICCLPRLPAFVCIAPLLRSSSRAFVFSKLPRKSRIRPTVCSKRTFSCYFWRSCGGHTRMAELWGLAAPHATLIAGLPEGACSHRLCPPHALAPYAVRSTVRVGCAIEDAGNCQVLPHKLYSTKLLSPAAVHTPPHPHFGSFLASSLLIETMFISTTHPNFCRERIRMAGLQSLLIPHMLPHFVPAARPFSPHFPISMSQ